MLNHLVYNFPVCYSFLSGFEVLEEESFPLPSSLTLFYSSGIIKATHIGMFSLDFQNLKSLKVFLAKLSYSFVILVGICVPVCLCVYSGVLVLVYVVFVRFSVVPDECFYLIACYFFTNEISLYSKSQK